jgi:hypothetical protein
LQFFNPPPSPRRIVTKLLGIAQQNNSRCVPLQRQLRCTRQRITAIVPRPRKQHDASIARGPAKQELGRRLARTAHEVNVCVGRFNLAKLN